MRRSKRAEQNPVSLSEPAPTPPQPTPYDPPPLTPKTLQYVRDTALHNSNDTRKLIAELETWRLEIDATIAFLRAQQKG